MNNINSAEDFMSAVKGYIEKEGITTAELARKLNKPGQTVGDWIRKGVRRECTRVRLMAEHPELFQGYTAPKQSEEVVRPPLIKNNGPDHRSMFVLVKIEHARSQTIVFQDLLHWFLFEASAEERNQFRDSLGENWKQFLELTRAMTGERAFEIAKEERRIK